MICRHAYGVRVDHACGTGEPAGQSDAWFRFAFKWTDPKTGEARSRAGIQAYRIEGGKLAETWLTLQPLV